MSVPSQQKVHILQNSVKDSVNSETFKLETRDAPSAADLKDGEVIVKTTVLSNDPAQLIAMKEGVYRLYTTPNKQGAPVNSTIMGEVVVSKSQKWKEGDVVMGSGTWSEYNVLSDSGPLSIKQVLIPGQSPHITISVLGITGLTAYAGVFAEMKLKKEHTLVVSGAAGGVGSVVVQLAAKVIGCKKIIGIAGGPEKCKFVKSLGATHTVDYKDPNYKQQLDELLPEGDWADMYFDNVGGEILNHMLGLMKQGGFVSVCGAISGYNSKFNLNLPRWSNVIFQRLTIKGMLLLDHIPILPKAVGEMAGWLQDGTIVNTEGETVVETKFEDIPKTWEGLFHGQNTGKLLTKIV